MAAALTGTELGLQACLYFGYQIDEK